MSYKLRAASSALMLSVVATAPFAAVAVPEGGVGEAFRALFLDFLCLGSSTHKPV